MWLLPLTTCNFDDGLLVPIPTLPVSFKYKVEEGVAFSTEIGVKTPVVSYNAKLSSSFLPNLQCWLSSLNLIYAPSPPVPVSTRMLGWPLPLYTWRLYWGDKIPIPILWCSCKTKVLSSVCGLYLKPSPSKPLELVCPFNIK